MRYDLAGKVVLITGPARGIGAELARRCAARGARLSLVGMEPERLDRLARELGDGHHWRACDVTDGAQVTAAVEEAVARLGGIDVVVANAGIATNGTVSVVPMDALVRVIDVNLSGVVRTVSATLPHVVARRGHYLLVSSASAIAPMAGLAAYAAAKSGVETFGNILRLEVASRGVTVGVTNPCWIDTDLVRDARRDLASFERALRGLPGPFGTVTPLHEAVDALVAGIERRRRRIFIPRSLAPLAAIRQFFSSAFAERVQLRHAAALVERSEAESRQLGRAFGESSVGMGAGTAGGRR